VGEVGRFRVGGEVVDASRGGVGGGGGVGMGKGRGRGKKGEEGEERSKS